MSHGTSAAVSRPKRRYIEDGVKIVLGVCGLWRTDDLHAHGGLTTQIPPLYTSACPPPRHRKTNPRCGWAGQSKTDDGAHARARRRPNQPRLIAEWIRCEVWFPGCDVCGSTEHSSVLALSTPVHCGSCATTEHLSSGLSSQAKVYRRWGEDSIRCLRPLAHRRPACARRADNADPPWEAPRRTTPIKCPLGEAASCKQ